MNTLIGPLSAALLLASAPSLGALANELHSGQHHASGEKSCDALNPQTRGAVVRVVGDDGSWASGVVIGPNTVLTAAHAINNASKISVGSSESLLPARLSKLDSTLDLAVLTASTDNFPVLPLGHHELAERQAVWAVGFPQAQDQVSTQGFYEQPFNGGLQTTADVDSGHSGGALVSCESGRAVLSGMIRGYGAYKEGDKLYKLKDFSISVSANTIKAFLTR